VRDGRKEEEREERERGREGRREGGTLDLPTTMIPVPAKAFSRPVATILMPMAASILGREGGREGKVSN